MSHHFVSLRRWSGRAVLTLLALATAVAGADASPFRFTFQFTPDTNALYGYTPAPFTFSYELPALPAANNPSGYDLPAPVTVYADAGHQFAAVFTHLSEGLWDTEHYWALSGADGSYLQFLGVAGGNFTAYSAPQTFALHTEPGFGGHTPIKYGPNGQDPTLYGMFNGTGTLTVEDVQPHVPAPEPTTLMLLAAGAAAFAGSRLRRSR